MTDPIDTDSVDTPSLDNGGRPEPPLAAAEAETLVGFLEYQRATLMWKFDGIDDDAAVHHRLSGHPSMMTLGGLVSHLAWVEDYWFTEVAAGGATPQRWSGIDWDADPDGEWSAATGHDVAALRTIWQESVDRSRTVIAQLLAGSGGAPLSATHPAWGGQAHVSLRWILVHMIEEYARHNGHADLLREAIDGRTGE